MKVRMFCIFDVKAQAFMFPFCMATDELAKRAFGDLARNKSHPVGEHREDYSLFYVGSFSDHNGLVEVPTAIECIMTGLDVPQTVVQLPLAK